MPVLKFILFFTLFLLLILAIGKKKRLLSNWELILVFAVKVAMACLYGYIFFRFYEGDDTWRLHELGLFEHDKLVRDPAQFIIDLDPLDPIRRNESLSEGLHFLLLDYEFWLITKPLAIFNFLSGGNYYINLIFFSFITFWGLYWLFSLLVRIFPAKRKWLFFFIFLFPPTLFWLSGLRADGMLMFFFSLMLFNFYEWVHERKVKSFVFFLAGLTGVLIFRDVLVFLLIPALLAWFLVVRFHTNTVRTFAGVWAACLLIFFGSALLPGTDGLPAMIAARQHAYLELEANTRFDLDPLDTSITSYVQVLPQAVHNVFLRPYMWEAKGLLQLATAFTTGCFWLLLILVIFRKEQSWRELHKNPIILFIVFFGLSLYLLIGYTVPFPGAIVRYKVIPELLLFLMIVIYMRVDRKPVRKDMPYPMYDKK